jgi:hypothetical protein
MTLSMWPAPPCVPEKPPRSRGGVSLWGIGMLANSGDAEPDRLETADAGPTLAANRLPGIRQSR